ncbi:hypothetical protein [Salinimicrobium flavum]|uniref:Uncharacterized protein n=1 Tax=Salinimicrobium flavum TaxID=1737065 RepID=A0ABW5IZM8_9FLAO
MPRSVTRRFTGNEKEIDELLKQNDSWKDLLSYAAEEAHFIDQYLSADIFQKNSLNMYEKLQLYSSELENLRSDYQDLSLEVHNHHYDIEGMLECEDISCEIFYHDEHFKLERRVLDFIDRFKTFKLKVFSNTSGLLRKTSKEY